MTLPPKPPEVEEAEPEVEQTSRPPTPAASDTGDSAPVSSDELLGQAKEQLNR